MSIFVKSNTTGSVHITRSRRRFCRGRAISVIYSVCVCVCVCVNLIAHAPYYIVIRVVTVPYFSPLSHKRYDFQKEKKVAVYKRVFIVSTIFSETFLISDEFSEMLSYVHTFSCEVPVILS